MSNGPYCSVNRWDITVFSKYISIFTLVLRFVVTIIVLEEFIIIIIVMQYCVRYWSYAELQTDYLFTWDSLHGWHSRSPPRWWTWWRWSRAPRGTSPSSSAAAHPSWWRPATAAAARWAREPPARSAAAAGGSCPQTGCWEEALPACANKNILCASKNICNNLRKLSTDWVLGEGGAAAMRRAIYINIQ